MSAVTHPGRRAPASDTPRPADVLVVFGISGDLAKVMTFRSLYRLEARGLLRCPIVGVAADDWSADDLREHARTSIETAGEGKVDPAVFDRFAQRLSYVSGDFADAETFERVAHAIDGAETPVFYLEIPPFLFGTVIKGLADAGLTDGARVVVEKPFGHDLESAKALNDEVHAHLDESQLFRIDHFLGKMGVAEILYLRFANAMLEPVWNRHYVARSYGSMFGLWHGLLERRTGEPLASAAFGATLMTATFTLFPLLGRTPPPWRWPADVLATSVGTHVAYVAAVAAAS